ncbi:hypothetical protein BJX70DRAFT_402732 [Aspergillus crustosus]
MSSEPRPGKALFERLPVEILHNKIVFLSNDLDQWVSTRSDSVVKNPSLRALYSLAATSRRLNLIAQPLLYRTIIVDSAEINVTLVKNLAAHPRPAMWVKTLVFREYKIKPKPKPKPADSKKRRPSRALYGPKSLEDIDIPPSPSPLPGRVPLSPIQRLWEQSCQQFGQLRLMEEEKNTPFRDAALNLIDLICRLTNLTEFLFVGRDSAGHMVNFQSTFFDLLTTAAGGNYCGREFSCEPVPRTIAFPQIKHVSLAAVRCVIWYKMTQANQSPALHTAQRLTLDFSTYSSFRHERELPSLSAPALREIRVSLPEDSLALLLRMLWDVEPLEVLHILITLPAYPPYHNNSSSRLFSAIRKH